MAKILKARITSRDRAARSRALALLAESADTGLTYREVAARIQSEFGISCTDKRVAKWVERSKKAVDRPRCPTCNQLLPYDDGGNE